MAIIKRLLITASYPLLLLLLQTTFVWAAAPDDISANQRGWYDARDVNGNSDFTDNPTAGSAIATWVDKGPASNNVSQATATLQPTLKTLAANYGLKFNGGQKLQRIGDIWAGAVTDIDIFSAASSDALANGWFISSNRGPGDTVQRVGAHLPWSDNITYWDRGSCCTATSRLSGANTISIGTETKYAWNFYASHTATNDPFGLNQRMYVMQNGNNGLSSTGVDTYTPLASAIFAIGAEANSNVNFMNATMGELILYQRTLNTAERNILNSYLFARWAIPGTLNRDQYAGDTVANYRHHVGGIGQVSTGAVATGTSLGLTISVITESNNQYLLAGLQNLTPTVGTVTTNIPITITERAARDWYIDRSPNNAPGTTQLTFNLATLGMTNNAGDEFALLYRATTADDFTALDVTSAAGLNMSFTVSAPNDGLYTIGKVAEPPIFTVRKIMLINNDPINGTSNPKAIPESELTYDIRISNSSLSSDTNDSGTVNIDDSLDNNLSFFTGNFDGSGSPVNFVPGAPSCNLTFSFVSFASTSDDIDFFDGSGGAITSITPDADGYDNNIRRITIKPQGIFNAKTASAAPDPVCNFSYKARLN